MIVKEQTISTPVQMEIVKLETELAKARISYSENHPKVQNLIKNIEALRKLLESGAEDNLTVQTVGDNPVKQALLSEINSLKAKQVMDEARKTELARLIDEVENRLKNTPSDELTLSRLEREKKGLENTYFSLLSKFEEARMMKNTAAGNLSILEEADLVGPIRDNIFVNLLFALILGQLVGGVLAVVIDTLDPRIKFSAKIEDTLGIPVIGLIPELREEERYVRFDSPKSRIVEAYHIIKSNLSNALPKDRPWSLMITSPFQGEGKTLMSLNLATAMALTNKPTVLIDADMRRTYPHEKFNLQKHLGLSEYLHGEADIENILKDTNVPNLKVITAGRKPQNPAQLLHSQEISKLFNELIERGYYVIVDSPALLPIVDSSIIASQVDGVILVFREEATRKYTAQKTIERMARIGANVTGAILNQASIKGYGYYFYYGYRYGYDYGYSEKVESGV
jgi:capsular exopolysaccharide synthesis family protein